MLKILYLKVENYKGIKYLEINDPSTITVLIGKNGSGKSTILQLLNHLMKYLNGVIDDYPTGISIKIDLTDHKIDFENWLNGVEISQITNKYINQWPLIDRNQGYSFSTTLSAGKLNTTEVISILNNEPTITLSIARGYVVLNRDDSEFANIKQIKIELDALNKKVTEKNIEWDYKKGMIFGGFFLAWLRSRNLGDLESIPGIAYLDMEKYNPRSLKLEYGKVKAVTDARSRQLYEQNWRGENLGTRLAALMLTYWAESEDQDKYEKPSPVERINKSLQQLLPYMKLKSPRPEHSTIYVEVRDEIIPISQLSSGEVSLLNFGIDYLEIEVQQGLLLIDEPDSHLHYELQKKFLLFLKDLVTIKDDNRILMPNIWIATHSPAIINSVEEDSVIEIDIDDEDNAARPLSYSKNPTEFNPIMKILGLHNTFVQQKVLFYEGITDFKYLRNAIYKFVDDSISDWRIIPRDGVDELLEIYDISLKLSQFSEETSMNSLYKLLNGVHFVFDADNKRQDDEFEDQVFVWNFYHLENLIFQDPWLGKVKTILAQHLPVDTTFDEILGKVCTAINENSKYLVEVDLSNDQWREKIPGREIYTELKKRIQGGTQTSNLFRGVINDTDDFANLPKELQRFLNWIEERTDV